MLFRRSSKEIEAQHNKEIKQIKGRLDKVEGRLDFLEKQKQVLRREADARG